MSGRLGLFADSGDNVPLVARKKLADGELDITPMIDVTFLLLIFFMVASNMSPQADAELPAASYGVGVETAGAMSIVIQLSDGAETKPRILLDGNRESDLDGVRGYVKSKVSPGTRKPVIIKAERRVPHGFVQEVTRAVMEIEGVQFYIGVHDK